MSTEEENRFICPPFCRHGDLWDRSRPGSEKGIWLLFSFNSFSNNTCWVEGQSTGIRSCQSTRSSIRPHGKAPQVNPRATMVVGLSVGQRVGLLKNDSRSLSDRPDSNTYIYDPDLTDRSPNASYTTEPCDPHTDTSPSYYHDSSSCEPAFKPSDSPSRSFKPPSVPAFQSTSPYS